MARPLRIELAGGLYHVTSRGDRRETLLRQAIAEHFGISRMTVSRAVKRHEDAAAADGVIGVTPGGS
ncbi:helix-turn-helix domain-containing protein [Thiococcus pfennigii]|uniref:helix-turn-helix domain-containing protein n=1 Tax=Thiococcus pfennigii TaxID=1057 RepID=UPI001F5BCFFF|nr:helix-turn-helix domain-containing protein [Thiococcus pfennigii]MBK1731185.1 hypothetical protein [Thiococcus pfennigii]